MPVPLVRPGVHWIGIVFQLPGPGPHLAAAGESNRGREWLGPATESSTFWALAGGNPYFRLPMVP